MLLFCSERSSNINRRPAIYEKTFQFRNVTHYQTVTLTLFFFTFGRLVVPSFGRRPLHCWREEPDSCALSLKVRIEMITDNPWLSFGSSGLGCPGSTCTLEPLGTLSVFSPSPWWCARFSVPPQPFAAHCSPAIWKPGFGFSYISTAPKEGVSMPKEWSVDHRFLCFPHNTLIWSIKRENLLEQLGG